MFTRPLGATDSQSDGWTHAMDWLRRLFDQIAARELPPISLSPDDEAAPPAAIVETMGTYLDIAAALGRRTAEMHLALAAPLGDQRFAPEPLTRDDLGLTIARARAHAERTLDSLGDALAATPARVAADLTDRARLVLNARGRVIDTISAAGDLAPTSLKIRIHGDYRLGQVLLAEGDVAIQNIEGHPAWPAGAQRERQSPLKDVASMLRSFSYAAYAALLSRSACDAGPAAECRPVGASVGAVDQSVIPALVLLAVTSGNVLAAEAIERETLLRLFKVDRALRELDGELNNRTEWVGIPLGGLVDLLGLE